MAVGIILAGGFSERMGKNKLVLKWDGKTLLEHAIMHMQPSVEKIIIVTGHYHQDIIEHLVLSQHVEIRYNRDYPLGMFSSVLTGIKHLDEDVFIVPGDVPNIHPSTYQMLLDHPRIAIPVYQGNKGHPIFIPKKYLKELQKEPITSNLKAFRDRHQVDYIHVDDPGILRDVNTKDAYDALTERK